MYTALFCQKNDCITSEWGMNLWIRMPVYLHTVPVIFTIIVPDYVKPGSWCRLSRAHNWFGETQEGREIGMGRERGGDGEEEVSLWATWDQGGQDRTTQEEGFQVSKRDTKN